MAARVKKLLSRSISMDGTYAQIVFEVDGARLETTLVLTIAVQGLAALQSLTSEMRRESERRNLKTGMGFRQTPKTYTVGHSDEHRGHIAIWLDEGTMDEQIFMFRDEDAIKVAMSIIEDIRKRGGVKPSIIQPASKIISAH